MPAPSYTPTEAVAAAGAALARGGVAALDGVTFALPAGSLAALVGANGSGKSTLLRVLAGVLEPDAGRVALLGLDPRRHAAALRSRVGYCEQDTALDPEMTGAETLRLFHALRELPRAAAAGCLAASIDAFGLAPFVERRVSSYSGGERQRLHLAIATLHAPELLLLDEPTTGIDAEGRRAFWGRMAERRAGGATALVATHDLAEAERHCDRVLVMHRGRIVADDAPAALVAAHGRARATLTLPRAVPADAGAELADALRATPGEPEVEVDGRTVTIWRTGRSGGSDPALAVLDARGVEYVRYEREDADLASACRRITGTRIADAEHARPRRGGGRGRGVGR